MMPGGRVPADVLAAFPGVPTAAVKPESFAGVAYQARVDDRMVLKLVAWLRAEMTALERVGLEGVVIGLSGGLDSVVAVRLCQMAAGDLGAVEAVTVDLGREGDAERVAAIRVCAGRLGVSHQVVDGAPSRAAFLAASPAAGAWSAINTDTRLIQSFLFGRADAMGGFVVSPTDGSERLLGRQTEAFYGQLEPLGALYKSDVRALARILGVLDHLADTRPGCEDYWYDDEVLGAGYDVIDPILHLLSVERRTPEWIADRHGITDLGWLRRIAARVASQPLRLTTRNPARSGSVVAG